MNPLPVQIIRSQRRKRTLQASIVDGTVRVLVPAGLAPNAEQRMVADLVAKVTAKATAGRIDLTTRSRRLARRYGLPTPRAIEWSTRQLSRWGSCTPSADTIRISNRLAAMPPWVLDAVLIHELAHLAVPDHGADFQTLVRRYQFTERATGYLMAVTQGRADAADDAPGPVLGGREVMAG
ncbi:MAG: M48 family metallopeptidase [Acidimicrobiia bacterium]|nr:M48 family metallopeptidase [Acidimicrobiia bacterium]